MVDLKLPKQRVHIQDARITRRILAFLVDILVLDLFILGGYEAVVSSMSIQQAFSGMNVALTAAAVTIALIALTYFALFEWLLGQTPGMMMLSIETQGVTLWKSFVRNLYFLPLFPFPLLWLLEPFHLIWKKTRLLELLTKTRTIERISY